MSQPTVRSVIQVARRRELARRAVAFGGIGLAAGSGAACLAILAGRLLPVLWQPAAELGHVPWWALAAAGAGAGVLGGAVAALARPWSDLHAARELDARLGLKDRLSTALEGVRETEFAPLIDADAARAAAAADVARAIDVRREWRGTAWSVAPVLLAACVGVGLWVPALKAGTRVKPEPPVTQATQEAGANLVQLAKDAAAHSADVATPERKASLEALEKELAKGQLDDKAARAKVASEVSKTAAELAKESEEALKQADEVRKLLADASSGRETSEVGEKLKRGDLAGAAEALQKAAGELSKMTPDEKAKLASDLQAMQQALEQQKQQQQAAEAAAGNTSKSEPQSSAAPGQPGAEVPESDAANSPAGDKPQSQPGDAAKLADAARRAREALEQPTAPKPPSWPGEGAKPDDPSQESEKPATPQQPKPDANSKPGERRQPGSDQRSQPSQKPASEKPAGENSAGDKQTGDKPDGESKPSQNQDGSRGDKPGESRDPKNGEPGQRGDSPRDQSQGGQGEPKPDAGKQTSANSPKETPQGEPKPSGAKPSESKAGESKQADTKPGERARPGQQAQKSGEQALQSQPGEQGQKSDEKNSGQADGAKDKPGSQPQAAPQGGTPMAQPQPGGPQNQQQGKQGDQQGQPKQGQPKEGQQPSDQPEKGAPQSPQPQGSQPDGPTGDQRPKQSGQPNQPGKAPQPGNTPPQSSSPGEQSQGQQGSQPREGEGHRSQPGSQPQPGEQGQPGQPGDSQNQSPSQALQDLAKQLSSQAGKRDQAARSARDAQNLEKQAQDLLRGMTPEQRQQLEQLAKDSAKPQEGPRNTPPGGEQPSGSQPPPSDPALSRSGQGKGAGGSGAGAGPRGPIVDQAPMTSNASGPGGGPIVRPGGDLSAGERPVAPWMGDDRGSPNRDIAAPATTQTVREAANGVERAIEQQAVPPAYADVVRRVFRRYVERASPAAPPVAPTPAKDAPKPGGP